MDEYYGGGWSASKFKLYFWFLLAATLVTAMVDIVGVINTGESKSAQQMEQERQTGQWNRP